MIEISKDATIGQIFSACATLYGDNPFLAIPANAQRSYAPDGLEISYRQAAEAVDRIALSYAATGYGPGHRIGLHMGNQADHLLHKLGMNQLGICCVPLNPDHRPAEMAYVIEHARLDLIIVIEQHAATVAQALELTQCQPTVIRLDDFPAQLAPPAKAASSAIVNADSIASILYTSGTTGKPKGCLLSHRYEIAAGKWYASRGGAIAFNEGSDRIYNPLPLFHVNSSVFSFFCAMLQGNCQIQADRFHPLRWWPEIVQTRATVVHYIGVVIPMLLNQPASPKDRVHQVRFALGAGVDPQRHAEFEQRFGFPLVEGWGMTEMVRLIFDCEEPRKVGSRSVGRVSPGIEARIVDDAGVDLPDNAPGLLLVRHSEATPRAGFFSGYLDDDAATAAAWKGGWFHTGDVMVRDGDGILHFVERRKNIIRRSGENIAAAEVEAVLQMHPWVSLAAVVAVQDELRDEEVLACVVLKQDVTADAAQAANVLFEHCSAQLAYFKAPGWMWFTDSIPTTQTQKLQKHQLFAAGTDPRTLPGMIDLRTLKRRQKP